MPACRRTVAILVLALCLPLPGAGAVAAGTGQPAPVGPEFRVDTSAGTPEGTLSVGASAAGGFLVLWEARTPDGRHDGLWSQWFSASGQPLGGNRLLAVDGSPAYDPVAAPGSHGGVVVLWRETHSTGGGAWDALLGGELLPDGSWAIPPHRIASFGTLVPRFVSRLPRGGYAIALLGFRSDHPVDLRSFLVVTDGDLKAVRSPREISPTRDAVQEVGGLAMSPTGELLVTWTEAETTIRGQLFSAAGRPLASPFRVPAEGTLPQFAGAAAALGALGYVVVWSEYLTGDEIPDIRMRLLNPDGAPRGRDLRLDPTIRARGFQQVAADAAGNFFVVWQEGFDPPDGDDDIFGRLYHPDGAPFGPKVRLNQQVVNEQMNAQVAAGPGGAFVVVWQTEGPGDGDGGIYGRLFALPAVPATAHPE